MPLLGMDSQEALMTLPCTDGPCTSMNVDQGDKPETFGLIDMKNPKSSLVESARKEQVQQVLFLPPPSLHSSQVKSSKSFLLFAPHTLQRADGRRATKC